MFPRKILMLSALIILAALPGDTAQAKVLPFSECFPYFEFCKKCTAIELRDAIGQGFDVNLTDPDGKTALMVAAGNTDYRAVIREMVKAGADIHARDQYGTTPLMYAAHTNKAKIADELIKQGARVNDTTDDGWTALMFAVRENYMDSVNVVNVLLKHKADANAKSARGVTALICAAYMRWTDNDESIIHALLKAKADVNAQDENGMTPLINAAWHNLNPRVIDALLDAKSDVNHKDNRGFRAIDYARENGSLRGTDTLARLEKLSRKK